MAGGGKDLDDAHDEHGVYQVVDLPRGNDEHGERQELFGKDQDEEMSQVELVIKVKNNSK